ncbi:phosphate/phosphite/phosphonate ABC transporter substrate-binding protein [Methylocella sp. CPCC 101449]|uniref:phosphate/phosphite/phosphonate ABC transporter substrate-binding protein n=1 Tax=Methylocella sp. CPCC 101449 TaxID=2987531 RepID=UPI00288EBACE|nr:phosphate/phosphite/phosphonate ABC transporter substrate-binding protein [Methylocella sp. CPCC 101449]MDT2019601.1 phosphate/phosphite/phosphonate ABC transporter substrate-binding protein [Methylocella sp. CPCC 101449]
MNSTSGYLVPTTFVFAAKGIDPKQCFKNVTNANHETNAMAVANGQVNAAANNTENLALIEKNNPAAFAKLRILWKSPLIPSDPIVWRKNLPEATKEKIRNFFLTYGTDKSKGNAAKEREILTALQWAPFKASTNDQLLPIRVMELTRTIAKIEADSKLSAEEKKTQLDKLRTEKADYEARIKSSQS